jgi:hypothetical protein
MGAKRTCLGCPRPANDRSQEDSAPLRFLFRWSAFPHDEHAEQHCQADHKAHVNCHEELETLSFVEATA